MSYPLRVIAERLGAELLGNAEEPISGMNALEAAGPGELAFAEDQYAKHVSTTRASGVIVSRRFPVVPGKNLLRVERPRVAFVQAMWMFHAPEPPVGGVHPSAAVSASAVLGDGVGVRACAVVQDRATIGAGTIIDSGVYVGPGVVIGRECWIRPNVVLMEGVQLGDRVLIHAGSVIGGDGFEYGKVRGRHVKIPQAGRVILEDDVELGCNVCVSRAAFGETIIRRGTKVDNLVQIGHNAAVGPHAILCGQVGLAGHVTIGERAILGGQASAADHVTIGPDVRTGASTLVTEDVRAGAVLWGAPSRPLREHLVGLANISRLPKLVEHVKELAARLISTESRLHTVESRSRRR